MNILICGQGSSFCSQIIWRLNKEQHEVYLISGSADCENVSAPVFQEYHFSYSNENILKTVATADPRVMVIMGASDTLYSWNNSDRDAIDYLKGLSSLLVSAKKAGVKRVIYISSIEAAAGITRSKTRDLVLAQAEKLCFGFADDRLEVIAVRLPGIAGGSNTRSADGVFSSFARAYFKDGNIQCIPGKQHLALHYKDAAEIFCRLILNEDLPDPVNELLTDDSLDYKIYQFKGLCFTEKELAAQFLETGSRPDAKITEIRISDSSTELPPFGATHEDLFLFSPHHYLDEIVQDISTQETGSTTHKNAVVAREKSEKHFMPLIEVLIIGFLTCLLTSYIRTTWVGENFSFFIIYILLFGATYGVPFGLLAAIVASVGELLLTAGGISAEQFRTYDYFLHVLQFISTGVLTGYMRDKYKRRNLTLEEGNRYLSSELNDVIEINDGNLYVKDIYEKRLLSYQNSLGRIYDLTTQLDFLDARKVIFQAVRVIREMLEVDDVAIYLASHRSSYFRLSATSSARAAGQGKSMHFDKDNFCYAAISQHEIYQNHAFDPHIPTFAGAVYQDENPIAIIMVWSDDLTKVNMYESNLFAILCRLIEKSITRSELYESALREDSYIEGTLIMNEEAFRKIFEIYQDGRKQGLLPFVFLRLDLNGKDPSEIQTMIRDTDVLGIMDGAIHVILSYSNDEDAAFVIDRFKENGIGAEIVRE